MSGIEDVYKAIPHREPFLFVDSIIEITETGAKAKRMIRDDEAYFQGHYPGNPIMPGVLMCEAIFQTAAVYLANKFTKEGINLKEYTPVLSRIKDAKFKQMVIPGEEIQMEVEMIQSVGQFHFMKGLARKEDGKVAVSLECALALIKKEQG